MSNPISIPLTVKSRDNKEMNYSGTFVVANIQDLMANQNKETAVTITDDDTTSQTSSWALTSGNFKEGQVLYYTIATVSGTTRRVRLYSNSGKTNMLAEGTATIADGASGTIYFTGNTTGIVDTKGSVTLTIGGGGLTAQDNTLTLTNVTQLTNLQVPGESQFMYREGVNRFSKYTVSETVSAIQLLINPVTS